MADPKPGSIYLPPEGPELKLRRGESLAEAARRVLRRQFERMTWNESCTRAGADPECLHQMRVATRRLRAALSVFHEALGVRRARRLRADLRRFGTALGAVRDLDVQIARLDAGPRRGTIRIDEALGLYRAFLQARREKARLALLHGLSGERYRGFVHTFRGVLEERGGTRAGREDAGAAGARIVRKRLRKALRGGRRLTALSGDAGLHAERIRLKRLRYACEFFADLLGPEATRFAARVTELQDALGEQHDAVVGRETLSDVARRLDAPPALRRQTILMFARRMSEDVHRERTARREFFRLWQRFDRGKTRRALKAAMGRAEKSGKDGAEGGSRTLTPGKGNRFLKPARLPVPPLRRRRKS